MADQNRSAFAVGSLAQIISIAKARILVEAGLGWVGGLGYTHEIIGFDVGVAPWFGASTFTGTVVTTQFGRRDQISPFVSTTMDDKGTKVISGRGNYLGADISVERRLFGFLRLGTYLGIQAGAIKSFVLNGKNISGKIGLSSLTLGVGGNLSFAFGRLNITPKEKPSQLKNPPKKRRYGGRKGRR